jgi:hypothetical protein
MAAFTRANTIGWAPGDPVTAAQMNALDADHVKAPNFVDGLATYAPAGLIQIGGAGFQWNGPSVFASTATTTLASGSSTTLNGSFYVDGPGAVYLRTNGRIVVQSTGEIAVATGGDLVIEAGGAMNWESGALITAEDGSTFQLADGSVLNLAGIMNFGATSEIHGDPTLMSGAELTFASGSDVTASSGSTTTFNFGSSLELGGTSTISNNQTLALSPARSWARHSLRICNVAYVSTTTPSPNVTGTSDLYPIAAATAWPSNHTGSVDPLAAMFVRVLDSNHTLYTELHYHWIALDNLPIGGTISQVAVRAQGQATTPTTSPSFQVVRWTAGDAPETMSALSNMGGTWGDEVVTTLAITSNSTISNGYMYAVVITHPRLTGSGPVTGLWILDVVASGTISSMVIG